MNPGLDAKLSALLDGELSPEETEALRAELARSPELTARLAILAEVDDGLRALPGRAVPSDLRVRVERQIREDVPARPRAPEAAHRAPPRARRRWLVASVIATAAAAALVLVLLPQLGRDEAHLARVEPEPAPPAQIAERVPEAKPAPEAPAPPAPVPAPALEEPAAQDVALADDWPVIEVLDVLAELDELEEVGSG
jgi:anti-sigma factor RsiW